MGCRFDVVRVRDDFPILRRTVNGRPLVYFDNAATSQKPRQVIDAVREFYEYYNANIHRGVHTLSQEATDLFWEAHEKVKEFVNAESAEEIIFTRNATEAINLVAYAWGLKYLKEGDEILTTVMEHHSNLVPWQFLRDVKGAKLRYVDITGDGRLDLEDMRRKINEKTKLVAVTYVSNVLGTVNPIEEIVSIARETEALVLVDGAQAAPHIPIDVRKLDIDFLAVSGHKMLGPTGIGFLYAKKEHLLRMNPFLYGGDMIREVTLEGATWNDLPWKFEAGTSHISGGIGLGAAVDYLTSFGMDCVFEHEKELTKYALERMRYLDGVILYGPEERIGVISFNIEGVSSPHDVAEFLNNAGIAIRSGCHCAHPLIRRLGVKGTARASFYIYNTKEEVDYFIDALREFLRKRG